MIIIWRGMGFLVAVFAGLGVALGAIAGGERHSTFAIGVGLVLSGILCTACGASLQKRRSERHDLYFIPVVAWGPIIGGIGLIMLLSQLGDVQLRSSSARRNDAAAPANENDASKILESIFTTPGSSADSKGAAPPTTSTPSAAPDPAALTIADGFVLRPTFTLNDEEVTAGTAFAIEVPGQNRLVIVSALHLLGPSGGLSADVAPERVPLAVKGLTLHDAYTEELVHDGGHVGLTIADAAPLGTKSPAGDIIAFMVNRGVQFSPRKLAASPPKRGDRVFMAAALVGGRRIMHRLHPATVMGNDARGDLVYNFDDAGIELRATSGAPVLDAAGEVVAINLGGFTVTNNGVPTGRVSGVGNPVGRFRQPLLKAISQARPSDPLASSRHESALANRETSPKESAPAPVPPTRTPPSPPPEAKPEPEPKPETKPTPAAPQPEPPRIDAPRGKEDPALPPRTRTPRTPRTTPRPEREPTLFDAEFKMRVLVSRVTSAAFRNSKVFPKSLDNLEPFPLREEDKVDPWGDGYLYFGAGRKYDIFNKTKTLLLASAKPHDGKRVVAYCNGDVESVSESQYQKMAK